MVCPHLTWFCLKHHSKIVIFELLNNKHPWESPNENERIWEMKKVGVGEDNVIHNHCLLIDKHDVLASECPLHVFSLIN